MVGYSRTTSRGTLGFVWTQAIGMLNLGDVLGAARSSRAQAVSADGVVVVGWAFYSNVTAFIWDAEHGMRDLQEELVSTYGLNLKGWRLIEATGVSADGRTIVGYGLNPQSRTEAWIAHLGDSGRCVGDLNGDGFTDLTDLGILLADFGCTPPATCPGDLNGDGVTNLADLGILLADFGCGSP